MADEASIRMTVDSSQATAENQKYVREVTRGAQAIWDKSEQLNLSIEERAKFIEREIVLLRERNRLEMREGIATEHRLYAEGKITGKEKVADIATIRQEATTEESKINEVNKTLKNMHNDQKTAQQKAERIGQDISRMSMGLLSADTAGGMMTSASSGLLTGTMIGALLAVGIAKEVKGAMQMEPVMRDYSILVGKSMINTRKDVSAVDVGRLGDMGFKPSDYFTSYAQLSRASFGTVKEDILGIMAAEKATGISRAQTANLLGLERYGEGKITPLFSFFERYLRDTSQKISVLPEILQAFAQEGTRMMQLTGKIDSAAIASTVAVVGKQFGFTGTPLQTVVGALGQGLQQSSNPIIQALQFGTMSRAMPGASLWQMELAMENPLANPKYITGMLDQLKGISGGGEQYARTLYNVFGQFGISKNLADQLSKGTATTEDLLTTAEKFKKTGTGGYETRTQEATGELEKVTAKWQGTFEKSGFVGAETFAKELSNVLSGIGKVVEEIKNELEKSREEDAKENEERQKARVEAKSNWERTLLILRGIKTPGFHN